MLPCPKGHELEGFIVPSDTWICDICRNSVPKGDATARCSYCNFDMCESCYTMQLEGMHYCISSKVLACTSTCLATTNFCYFERIQKTLTGCVLTLML
jgi:hypothetical protein